MSEKKGLSHTAYGGVNGEDYVPYVPVDEVIPEATWASIIVGCFFAILFGAANVYLALNVGMTIAAIIPTAILGTSVLYAFGRKSILEANMVASIASMGESLAGGIVFTLPAIFVWGKDLSLWTIVAVTLLGGLVGILFLVPLRKYLMIEEHGKLTFPESMAASEVLVNTSTGGEGLKDVLTGLFGGGIYKFLSGALLLWSEGPSWQINLTQNGKSIFQSMFGIDALASLAGVGFIVGIEAALYMFAGGFIAYFALIPLIKFVGAGLTVPLFPSADPIAQMSVSAIRSAYIKYIGAGAVAAGGFISLGKSLPIIFRSIKAAMGGLGTSNATKRTELDVPMTWVIGGAVLVFFLAWLLPGLGVTAIGAFLAVLFSFLFAVVSARICGMIGASNNPVSGMTIATLLFITAVLKATGHTGNAGMISALLAGAIVCVAVSVAGGAAQGLKATHILGGTPKRVQIGMYVGVIASGVAAGAVMKLLINTNGIGGEHGLQAPQATLMSMVVKGVMDAQLPWTLVLVGVAFGIMIELLGLPVLPVALGIYLPISLSVGILGGAIVRVIVDRKYKNNEKLQKDRVERGILLSSGLVAGDALIGIVIAVLTAVHLDKAVGIGANIAISNSPLFATIIFAALIVYMYSFVTKDRK